MSLDITCPLLMWEFKIFPFFVPHSLDKTSFLNLFIEQTYYNHLMNNIVVCCTIEIKTTKASKLNFSQFCIPFYTLLSIEQSVHFICWAMFVYSCNTSYILLYICIKRSK